MKVNWKYLVNRYKIIEKKLDVNSFTVLMKSVVDDEIYDICAIGENIYSVSNSGLILLNTGETIVNGEDSVGKERFGTLRHSRLVFPTSLCIHLSNIITCEASGRIIRRIDLDSRWTKHENKTMKFVEEFRKMPENSPTGITAEANDIMWVVAERDVSYACRHGDTRKLAGTGKRGYSCSQTALLSQIAYPCGIAANSKTVYISEMMNRCIRYIQNGQISFLCGCPKEDILVNPKKVIHLRNQLLVVDDGVLKSITINDGITRAIPVYNATEVISVCLADKRILILAKDGKENTKNTKRT